MNNPYPEKLGIAVDSGRLFDVANPSHDAWNEAVVSLIKWLEEPCTRHKHYNEYNSTYSRKECSQCWQNLKEKNEQK